MSPIVDSAAKPSPHSIAFVGKAMIIANYRGDESS
jgi:hypothetical protein